MCLYPLVGREEQRLVEENSLLRQEVTQLKATLVGAETRNGGKLIQALPLISMLIIFESF